MGPPNVQRNLILPAHVRRTVLAVVAHDHIDEGRRRQNSRVDVNQRESLSISPLDGVSDG